MCTTKLSRGIIVSIIGILSACFSAAIASWLLAMNIAVEGVSSLPFGLFVFSGVVLLLSANNLVEPIQSMCPCRKRRHSTDDIRTQRSHAWHAMTASECACALGLDAHARHVEGLSSATASRLKETFGLNQLPSKPSKPLWRQLIKEVHEPQQTLLLVVAILYALVGEVSSCDSFRCSTALVRRCCVHFFVGVL
jgi:hypothetical protein